MKVVEYDHRSRVCPQPTIPNILMPLAVVHKTTAPVAFFVCTTGDDT